jgi:hypothetical protein
MFVAHKISLWRDVLRDLFKKLANEAQGLRRKQAGKLVRLWGNAWSGYNIEFILIKFPNPDIQISVDEKADIINDFYRNHPKQTRLEIVIVKYCL